MFVIDPEKCTQCGECQDICPTGAISQTPEGPFAVDNELCADCAVCQEICEQGSISEIEFQEV